MQTSDGFSCSLLIVNYIRHGRKKISLQKSPLILFHLPLGYPLFAQISDYLNILLLNEIVLF